MLTSMMIFFAALLITIPILTLILPNFKKQKQLADMASWLNKNESELNQLNQGAVIRYFSQSLLPSIDEKWSLDNIFGKKLREKFLALGRKESYLEYLATVFVKSFLIAPLVVVLSMLIEDSSILFLAPVSVVMLFVSYMNQINSLYKKRQNLLIKDLPNLISKMMISLETGNSFIDVFKRVADESNPLLGDMLKRVIANTQTMPLRDSLLVFAKEVDLPVMYDFISVVNVGLEKGYKEALPDFDIIKNDLRELRKLSLIEMTKGNPGKMNIFYGLLMGHVLIFLFLMMMKLFAVMNSL